MINYIILISTIGIRTMLLNVQINGETKICKHVVCIKNDFYICSFTSGADDNFIEQ